MKIRYDFVTNSSSSSFIINKKNLDEDQIKAIRYHSQLGDMLGIDYADEEWLISENKDFITGYTSMDNFDFEEFFRCIDVSDNIITWGEYPFSLNDARDDNPIDDISEDKSNWRQLLQEID